MRLCTVHQPAPDHYMTLRNKQNITKTYLQLPLDSETYIDTSNILIITKYLNQLHICCTYVPTAA